MKRIFLYGLLACVSWTMQSCLFSEDDVFEQSSAERDNASVAGIKELLMSSPNGWNLEYRYGEDGDWGVSNIFMKFDETNVTMASDYATSNYAVGEECQSLYTVQAYQGTEISFDSYNEILHSFCEPEGYNAPGLIGDYEFVVRDTTSNSITLTGKKYGVEMVMTRLSEDVDWTAYLQSAATLSDNTDLPLYNVVVGGQVVGEVERTYMERSFTVTEEQEDGSSSVTYYPFMCTDNGIRLVEPLVFGSVSLQNFAWDETTRSFVCTDEGVDARLEYVRPEGYERYVGNYTLSYVYGGQTNSLSLELQPYKESRSYISSITLPRGIPIQLIFNYDMSRDDLSANGQVVGAYNGIDVYLYPGTSEGSLYATTDFTIEGTTTINDDGTLTIPFAIGAPYGDVCDSWLFIYYNNGYYLAGMWTSPVVLTKLVD